MKKTEPEFYPPVENLLDLIYEHYTENNPAAPKTTVAGRAAKEKEKELERNTRGQTRAPSKGHFTEQAEILHEKRITTSFVSESCMTLGNWNHEA